MYNHAQKENKHFHGLYIYQKYKLTSSKQWYFWWVHEYPARDGQPKPGSLQNHTDPNTEQ